MAIWYQDCYCGDNVKCGLFQNTCFKERNNMAVGKTLRVTTNFYKNSVFQLSHCRKNIHRIKLYQNHTHWRNRFLQLQLLKVCESFLFGESKKMIILWSVRVFFTFLEKKKASKYALQEANLFFYMYIFTLMCHSVY